MADLAKKYEGFKHICTCSRIQGLQQRITGQESVGKSSVRTCGAEGHCKTSQRQKTWPTRAQSKLELRTTKDRRPDHMLMRSGLSPTTISVTYTASCTTRKSHRCIPSKCEELMRFNDKPWDTVTSGVHLDNTRDLFKEHERISPDGSPRKESPGKVMCTSPETMRTTRWNMARRTQTSATLMFRPTRTTLRTPERRREAGTK